MSPKNRKKNLTELQAAAVEAYRQRLAETVPEVEILNAFATDGIIEVKLKMPQHEILLWESAL